MIARMWSARTTRDLAPAYAEHLRSRVIPELSRLEGFVHVMLLERESAGDVDIVVQTLWRSLDAIRAFAGGDLEQAVVADEAAALLTDFDRRVRHYEVVIDSGLQV